MKKSLTRIDGLHLFRFCRLAPHAPKFVKKNNNNTNITLAKTHVASATAKNWVESEYYLNLESEDKKRYKKLTLSNCELLPDSNVPQVYF